MTDGRLRHELLLAQLAREGLVTPAVTPPGKPPPARRPIMSLEQLLAELDESREDR